MSWQLQVLLRLGELALGVGIGTWIFVEIVVAFEHVNSRRTVREQVRQSHLRLVQRPYDWEVDE